MGMNAVQKIVVNLRLTAAALDAEAVKLRETADIIENSIPVTSRIVPVDFGGTVSPPRSETVITSRPDNKTYGA